MPAPSTCLECGHLSAIHAGSVAPFRCSWPGCPCTGAIACLTYRETQVLKLTARGFRLKNIATELGMSTHTASLHRYYLMKKLGLHNSVQVMLWALRYGVIGADDINSVGVGIEGRLASRPDRNDGSDLGQLSLDFGPGPGPTRVP